MDNTKTCKIPNTLIEIGWLLIFGLSPIFFAPFVYGVWQIGEYFLFQILVEVILFVWLLKIVLTTKQLNNLTKYLKFILPAVIFIVVLGLSTFFSQSPHYSFWGTYYRKMGYVMWLHFFALFSILFFNIKTKKQIARIFYIIVSATAVVVIYGLFQLFGFDIFPWKESAFVTRRIFSTLGQPNFLGSWLLLSIPIVIWTLIRSSQKRFNIKRPVLVCLFLLCVFVLVLTQSRAGWIGFFFGFFFFTIIFSFIQKQKRLGVLLLILFLTCMVFVSYLNVYPLTSRPDDTFLERRFKTLTQLSVVGKLRLIRWHNSLDLIKQKPVLGYGLETQHLNFVKYYTPEYAALEAINTIPDRAHNDILDMVLTSGILGLVSYLLLIGTAFWLGIKYVFKNKDYKHRESITALVLITGLLSYLISIQFSFHVIPTGIYFWAYLAIIYNLCAHTSK